MTTKKDAAAQIMYVANQMRESLGGDEEADDWISFLESIAYGLDRPTHNRLARYDETVSRKVKLRTLIDHPDTGEHERASAIRKLNKLRAAERETA